MDMYIKNGLVGLINRTTTMPFKGKRLVLAFIGINKWILTFPFRKNNKYLNLRINQPNRHKRSYHFEPKEEQSY